MADEVFALLIGFGVPAAVILLPLYWRAVERRQLIAVVRTASERGEPVPLELLDALSRGLAARAPNRNVDLRRGAFLFALAMAMVIIGYAVYAAFVFGGADPQDRNEATVAAIIVGSIGAIPGCVGLAYLALGLTSRRA